MVVVENQIYVFKIALKDQKGIWRKIAMRGDQTLAVLHDAIFKAYNRSDPHLYTFFFSNKPTSSSRARLEGAREYGCPYSETDYRAKSTRIDSLHLQAKDKFEYLFDYGDEWWHEITLEAIQPQQTGLTYPCVIAAKGESPPQYDNGEDEE